MAVLYKTKVESFSQEDKNPSVRNIVLYDNFIEAELQDDAGEWRFNRIKIHPLLKDKLLVNENGIFTYKIKDSSQIKSALFPKYMGDTISQIKIDNCVMLSVNVPKYNRLRKETLDILESFQLPPTEVYFGYTPETVTKSRFYHRMKNPDKRNELTLGMLEIFDNFVKKYPNKNAWLLYFEDDVRPVNVEEGEDLSILYNVPKDAELIRPYIGLYEPADMTNIKYSHSYGGGLNHAFYISVSGCKKVLKYVENHKWQFVCDIDLYKLARGCDEYPTELDGWSLRSSDGKNDISKEIPNSDKINMYSMSHVIFDQTSNPLV